jgi:hypothetical protein
MVTQEMIEELIAAGEPAFEAARAEREALAPDRLLPVEVHVPMIVLAVAMTASRIEEVVGAAQATIPATFDRANVTRLRTYAAAAWRAHVRSTRVSRSGMRKLLADAVQCRQALLVWAHGLADCGWLRKDQLAGIGHEDGPHALALDCVGLAEVLTETWPRCEMLGLHAQHLARATALGLDLVVALSAGTHAVDDGALRERARAFSVLERAYEECRRLIRWLRRDEGDLEDIAPSIGTPVEPDDEGDDDPPIELAAARRARAGHGARN